MSNPSLPPRLSSIKRPERKYGGRDDQEQHEKYEGDAEQPIVAERRLNVFVELARPLVATAVPIADVIGQALAVELAGHAHRLLLVTCLSQRIEIVQTDTNASFVDAEDGTDQILAVTVVVRSALPVVVKQWRTTTSVTGAI